ncbi:MAG: S41 family peptidase [Caldibacillus sp.]
MDLEQKNLDGEQEEIKEKMDDRQQAKAVDNYFKIKKFHAVLILFLLVFFTAGITAFALSFGDEKVVEKIQVPVERSEFSKLYQAYDLIQETYFEDVDKEALIDGAIDGMVKALGDPYSEYMTAEESEKFFEELSSSFEGIGAHVEQRNDQVVIVAPIKGSPAEKAGLKPNDVILEVDGRSIQGMNVHEAVQLIRGEKGTKVVLTIQRPGIDQPIKVEIIRDVIPIETVYSEMLEDGIGKIQISSFAERTLEELQTAIAELKEQGMKGLILDLRQNPGGLLEQAIEISSLFVPEGEVIYQMEFYDGSRQRQLSNQKEPFDLPLVIVVDGGSASASEILAAAAKESAGVPIVGEKTFGKGTAQNAKRFADGSNLKLTMAKWLTPSGEWINEKGITPDYIVPLPEWAYLPFIDPDTELKENMIADEVHIAEQMLVALGYEISSVDNYFTEETTAAVSTFQADHELDVTGILQGETTMKLMESLRDKLEKEDPQIQKAKEVLKEIMKKKE